MLLLPHLAHAQPLSPPPVPFGRVVDVVIDGAERTQPAAVRRVLGTYPGAQLDPAQLRDDIRAIWDLRSGPSTVFDDVRVEVERAGDGLRVIYVVHERPRLDEVVLAFPGGAPLEDEAREGWDVAPGDLYDPVRVRAAERAVEARYRDGGRPLARVESALVERDDGTFALRVAVDPGPELEVRRLVFAGNEALGDDELLAAVRTRTADLVTALSQRDDFDPAVLDEDGRRLTALYQDRGYAEAAVGPPEVEVRPGDGAVFVRVPIHEGPRFRVGSVALEGDLLAPEQELLDEYVRVTPGDWVSSSAVAFDRDRLLAAYRERGYARTAVRVDSEPDPGAATLALVFRLERGPLCRVGHITISGNTLTRDAVIRRHLGLLESDRFDGTALRESRERLARLGLFESVEIRELATDRPDVVDLEVVIVERDVLLPAASVGLGTDGTISARGQLATPNLFGNGQSLAALLELGTLRNGLSLTLTDPDVRATGWRVAGRLFWEEATFPDFSRQSLGGGLTAAYPLADDWRLSGGYVLEQVDVTATGRPTAAESLGQLFSAGRTARLLASLEWDTRDNPPSPHSGFLQQVSAAWGGVPVGSEVDFVSVVAASRWYAGLGPLVLRLNLELGYLVSTDTSRRVPIGERYFLGGPDTVRGFEPFTLSPTEPVPSEPGAVGSGTQDFPIGGNKYLQGNLELSFPLVPALSLEGVAFLDVGNTYQEDEGYDFGLDLAAGRAADRARALRTSAGLGLRWTILGGVPLRFEWGFPLAPAPGEEHFVFSVSAGLAF